MATWSLRGWDRIATSQSGSRPNRTGPISNAAQKIRDSTDLVARTAFRPIEVGRPSSNIHRTAWTGSDPAGRDPLDQVHAHA